MAKAAKKTVKVEPAKSEPIKSAAPPPPTELKSETPPELSDFVIKEIMIQKNVSKEEAIKILKNQI